MARAACGLPWETALDGLDQAAFPMLGALDPYGDAVFNHRQIPALLREAMNCPSNGPAPGLPKSAPFASWLCESRITTSCSIGD